MSSSIVTLQNNPQFSIKNMTEYTNPGIISFEFRTRKMFVSGDTQMTTKILLSTLLRSQKKIDSAGLHAGAVTFPMVGSKHAGRKELVGSRMIRERAAKES